MKKDKRNSFRQGFSQTICKLFNTFTFCSRQPTSCIGNKNPSRSNTFIITTPVIKPSKMHLSQTQIDYNHLKFSFYPTTFTAIDQMWQKEPDSSSSSTSSSPTSNCHSSVTIHQYYSTSTSPSTTATNIEMLNKSIDLIEKSSLPPQTSSHFSYLIRPSTPCIFGQENYDDETMNEDEFFLTAGGMVHSCPNIYELTIGNNRKLQSCDHLMFTDQQTTLVNNNNNNNNLNCYDTELDRYSILSRFHANLPSMSIESVDSELRLYKERHAIGFPRSYHDDISTCSSFFPTTWKSDNYLLLMPFVHDHQKSLSFNTIGHGKRSRSHDIQIGQACSSVIV